MQKVAFLDRDGTLNVDKSYVHKWLDFEWLPMAKDALKLLSEKGFKLAIITNQSGIARDLFTIDDVNELHHLMNEDLKKSHHIEIDYFKICEHHPDFTGSCKCRKPGTKLIEDVAREIADFDRVNSIMVGDKDSDYQCGLNSGLKSFQLSSNKYQSKIQNQKYIDLMEIVKSI